MICVTMILSYWTQSNHPKTQRKQKKKKILEKTLHETEMKIKLQLIDTWIWCYSSAIKEYIVKERTHICCSWRRHFVRFMRVKWKLQYFVRIACTFFLLFLFDFSRFFHYMFYMNIFFCFFFFFSFGQFGLCFSFFVLYRHSLSLYRYPLDFCFQPNRSNAKKKKTQKWYVDNNIFETILMGSYQDIIYYTTVWLPGVAWSTFHRFFFDFFFSFFQSVRVRSEFSVNIFGTNRPVHFDILISKTYQKEKDTLWALWRNCKRQILNQILISIFHFYWKFNLSYKNAESESRWPVRKWNFYFFGSISILDRPNLKNWF